MDGFAHETLEPVAERVVGRLRREGVRWVVVQGRPGSGRSRLVDRLEAREGAWAIRLPPLDDADAVGHGIQQGLGLARLNDRGHLEQAIAAGVASAVRGIAEEARRRAVPFVVLLLGRGWARGDTAADAAFDHQQEGRARAFLDAWRRSGVPCVLVGRVDPAAPDPIRLPEPAAPPGLLEAGADAWGALADAARALARRLGTPRGRPLHPLRLRFAVALQALDALDPSALGWLDRPDGTRHLARALTRVLARLGHERAVRRLARLRAPVPPRVFDAIVGDVNEPARSALRRGLAYGDDRVRVNPVTRLAIQDELRLARSERGAEHLHLAAAHHPIDGASAPYGLHGESLTWWLERVHHLARAGGPAAAEFGQLRGLTADQLVEAARTASLAEEFEQAAHLYARAVEADPGHHYAWHYLGFNRDRLARDAAATEAAYRRAVRLDPRNPWYRSRLCTFLVGQARFREAERAWTEALDALDPDQDRAHDDAWLARHLFRWVVLAWIEAGELATAREVIELLGPGPRREPRIAEVEMVLVDAEEVERYGFSVRPWHVRPSVRLRPLRVPDRDGAGRRLVRAWAGWFEAREGGGAILHGVPLHLAGDGSRAAEELLWEELDAAALDRLVGRDEPAGPWFELGEYEGGSRRLRFLREERPRPRQDRDPDRWLRGFEVA